MRKTTQTFVLLLCSVGCGQAVSAPSREIEPAPYEITEKGTLKVREDLAHHLVGEPARTASRAAEVEGAGHVIFAPGASYAVRAPFDGYVERVAVEVGDHVQVGAVLATLRSSEVAHLRAELRRLSATSDMEKDAAQRAARLVAQGAASPREGIESQARVSALAADLAGVRDALAAAKVPSTGSDLYELRASRSGDVLVRNIDPGERVQAGDAQPTMLVGNSNALVVAVHIPERDTTLLAVQAPCTFSLPALGGKSFIGRITSVTHAIDPHTRTSRVICSPNDPADGQLRSEMAARVNVGVQSSAAVVVARGAVLLRREQRVVFVRLNAEELERRVVTTGLRIGDDVQVLSGLHPGENVVTDGAVLLDGELDRLL